MQFNHICNKLSYWILPGKCFNSTDAQFLYCSSHVAICDFPVAGNIQGWKIV